MWYLLMYQISNGFVTLGLSINIIVFYVKYHVIISANDKQSSFYNILKLINLHK